MLYRRYFLCTNCSTEGISGCVTHLYAHIIRQLNSDDWIFEVPGGLNAGIIKSYLLKYWLLL